MTSRELLAVALLLAPTLTAILVALVPRGLVTRVAVAGALVTGGLALALAAVALGDPERRGRRDLDRRRSRRRAAGRRDRARRARQRARLARLPGLGAELARPGESERAALLHPPLLLLGDPARRPARRQPRRGVAARRGHDRRLGAPRRLQRQGTCARGGLEVPDPHLARPRRGAARDRAPRRRGARRRTRGALVARAHDVLRGRDRERSSRTSSCWRGSRPRSASRRCTTGFRTHTRRLRRPSRHSSRRPCFPPCWSSPGGASRRSRRSSARVRRSPS